MGRNSNRSNLIGGEEGEGERSNKLIAGLISMGELRSDIKANSP